jgi:hypothetical protein
MYISLHISHDASATMVTLICFEIRCAKDMVQESVKRNWCGGLPLSASACISGVFFLFFPLFSA